MSNDVPAMQLATESQVNILDTSNKGEEDSIKAMITATTTQIMSRTIDAFCIFLLLASITLDLRPIRIPESITNTNPKIEPNAITINIRSNKFPRVSSLFVLSPSSTESLPEDEFSVSFCLISTPVRIKTALLIISNKAKIVSKSDIIFIVRVFMLFFLLLY